MAPRSGFLSGPRCLSSARAGDPTPEEPCLLTLHTHRFRLVVFYFLLLKYILRTGF